MSDHLFDLTDYGIESAELFGGPMLIGLVVIDGGIQSSEMFGASELFEEPPTIISIPSLPKEDDEVLIPMPLCIFVGVIDLTNYSIPSAESFTPTYIPQAIVSQENFGTFRWGMELTALSIPIPENQVGGITIVNVLVYGIATREKFGIANVASLQEKPTLDLSVEKQFPEFVRENHPQFLKFMKAYYEWAESVGNVLHESKSISEYQDIDTTIDDYAEQLFKEFLTYIPRDVLVNRATLLKFVKQFYRAKGTEKSYKFFFRMLYNLNVEFYYPRVDILRASDGKWIQPKTVRVVPVEGDITKLIAQKIRGTSKNCTAFVERMFGIQEGPLFGYELFLNRSSVTGIFLPNEIIEAEVPNATTGKLEYIKARVAPIPVKVNITNPGSNYSIGQEFEIEGTRDKGFGGKVKIERVGPLGEIVKTRIISYGLDYDPEYPVTVDFSKPIYTPPVYGQSVDGATISVATITPAQGTVVLGATAEYPGYYLNEDGQLSTSKYLHDGEFYQQFSYVTFVNESLNQYREILKRLIHPIGLKHFGGVRIQNLLKTKLTNPNDTSFPVKRTIQNHLFGKLGLKTGYAIHNSILKHQESLSLGRNNYSIYRDRFTYKPFQKYDANVEIPNATPPYWGVYGDLQNQKAITPIKSFGHLKPADVERIRRGDKNNILSDAHVQLTIDETGDPDDPET